MLLKKSWHDIRCSRSFWNAVDAYFPRLVLLACFGLLARLLPPPPCWNCGTSDCLWLSSTKSICTWEGNLNENFVIPSRLVTAKSPRFMMFIPIKISAPTNSPLVTRTPMTPTLLGRNMLTRYVSDCAVPCTPLTNVRPVGTSPHASITAWVITQLVAPVSQIASNSNLGGWSSTVSGSKASEIRHLFFRTFSSPVPVVVKVREVMRTPHGSGMSENMPRYPVRLPVPKRSRVRELFGFP